MPQNPFSKQPSPKPSAPKKQTQYIRKVGDPIHYEDGSSEPDNAAAYERAASKPLYEGSAEMSRSSRRLLDGLLKQQPSKFKQGYVPKDMDR